MLALLAVISPVQLTNLPVVYFYPNDEQELDRLDMQHHMLKLVCDDRLFFSPLRKPKQILDIGTGSGIWAMEMGTHLLSFLTFEQFSYLLSFSTYLPRCRDHRYRPLTRSTNRSSRERPLPSRRCRRRRVAVARELL